MAKFFWPFLANVALFAAIACFYPFLVIYYRQQGLSGPQIGLLSGLTPLLTLLGAPLWTNLADATRRHRLVFCLMIVVTAATLALLPTLHAFAPLLVMIVVLSACFAPIIALLDSATLAMLGNRRELYGRVRVGGTLGYVVTGALIGALVQRAGLQFSFWTGTALLLVLLLAAQRLSFGEASPGAPPPGAAPVGAPQPAARAGGSVRTLLADRRWWPFLALAFAGGLASVISSNYLFAYMRELGAPESSMGLAITLSVVSEVPVLFFGNRLVSRFGPYPVLLAAMLITGLRLLLFFFAVTPTWVLLFQLLNGLTFPLMWVAGVAYAHAHAPPNLAATAQGLFGAMVYGFGDAVGGFAGGPLFERFGGRATYILFGVIILGIVALVAGLQRRAAEPAAW